MKESNKLSDAELMELRTRFNIPVEMSRRDALLRVSDAILCEIPWSRLPFWRRVEFILQDPLFHSEVKGALGALVSMVALVWSVWYLIHQGV